MIEPEYFAKKRAQLGMAREDVLVRIQATLDEWYPGKARARQLHQGVLRLATPSAAVAGALRMRQIELLDLHELKDVRLSISIQSLERRVD